MCLRMISLTTVFLLTRPMRDATFAGKGVKQEKLISTHAPHAGRDETVEEIFVNIAISTHAPHAGRDTVRLSLYRTTLDFYSRAPCGTRLKPLSQTLQELFLLTRPMRDATASVVDENGKIIDFYSRAPCGTRQRGM